MRTCAKLLIYPQDLSHSDITRFLGIEPTDGANKGDQRTNRFGKVSVVPLTHWFLYSEPNVHSLDLRAHLDWLLGKLLPKVGVLRQLQQEPEIKMAVECVWESKHGGGGPTLWPEQLWGLAELNLELAMDFQYYNEDEG